MKKISLKQKRAIELARRFATLDEISLDQWERWLPSKIEPLTEDQIGLVHSYTDGQIISSEVMFLLHSDCGITLQQIRNAGFQCSDVVEYARLLHGLRTMTVTVAAWKESLLWKWPLITLNELREDGYADLAESLRYNIVRGWLQVKHELPPGMDVAHMEIR